MKFLSAHKLPQGVIFLPLAVAIYFLFVSCSDFAPSGTTCVEDADCSVAGFCINAECRVSCGSDADCFNGEVCESTLRAEGGVVDVCVFEAPVDEFCSEDSECVQRLGAADAQCSIDNLCFLPQTLYSILIRDNSPEGPGGMDGLEGADIGAVFLTLDDKIVAQGSTLIARNENGDDLESPIKGGPPSLTDDMTCIDGDFSTDTVHLGRKGFLLVRFLDTNFSDYLEGPATWNVNVIEWGKNCGIADDSDTYTVSLCTTSSYENIDFERECVQIGNGADFSKFTTETQ